MKRRLFTFLVCLGVCATAYADFNDGVVAYLMGDYDRAYTTMRSLAETADHGYAQYYVGMMYLQGQGVEQSYTEAGHWFRKAAEHRVPQAQYKLGLLYEKGQGVPKDFEYAYAWFRVGAEHKHDKSLAAVAEAKAQLSAAELKEAEKLSARFLRDYGPQGDPDEIREIDKE